MRTMTLVFVAIVMIFAFASGCLILIESNSPLWAILPLGIFFGLAFLFGEIRKSD